MTPRVDIICLVHNSLPVTRGFVKSLFANTSNFRLIFVDNGSTDDTPEFLKEGEDQGRWKVISPGENLGVIGGRNLGVQHVEADFFMNIDNDQYPGPRWLEGLFALINKGYDVAGPEAWELTPPKASGALVMNGQVVSDRSYFPYKHCEHPGDTFTYIGCGGSLIKTSVYKKIGLFDERFNPAYFEDPDFCYDKKTHLYTDKGFILFSEVNEKTKILTRDQNDILVYQRPNWVIKKYEKELYHFCSQQIDIMCSKSQKLLVGYNRAAWGHDKGDFRKPEFITAEEVANKLIPRQSRYFIEKSSGTWIGNFQNIFIGSKKWELRNFAIFMAWYLSEGNICYDPKKRSNNWNYAITICQTEEHNRKLYVQEIQNAIHNLGFVSRVNSKGVAFSSKWFVEYLSRFGRCHEKYVPTEIKNATPAIIKSFLLTYLKGDGSISEDGKKWSFFTSSTTMKNDLVELLIKCSRSFTCFYKKEGNTTFSGGVYYCRGVWQIQSYEKNIAYLRPPKIVPYHDYVYDVNVDNHKILIMRNGKSCWSSNCFRALLTGFKLGWYCKCPITHLAHQTFNTQQLFNKNTQFQKSWKAFRDKWKPYFPVLMKMPR